MDEAAWCARANLEQPDVVQHIHEATSGRGAGDHRTLSPAVQTLWSWRLAGSGGSLNYQR